MEVIAVDLGLTTTTPSAHVLLECRFRLFFSISQTKVLTLVSEYSIAQPPLSAIRRKQG